MAFIVEDGTGLENATSYVDMDYATEYAETYFTTDFYNTWINATGEEKERGLNGASMYLDNTYTFRGIPQTNTQALQFPRGMVYTEGMAAITGVPRAIKQATCLAAIRIMKGIALSPDISRGGVIRERVEGAIDITYADGGSAYTKFTEIENLLKKANLIKANRNSGNNITLVQG